MRRHPCPTWCDSDHGEGNLAMATHARELPSHGSAGADLSQEVPCDVEADPASHFEVRAELYFAGEAVIDELTAVDCRDVAATMIGAADAMDEIARGSGRPIGAVMAARTSK